MHHERRKGACPSGRHALSVALLCIATGARAQVPRPDAPHVGLYDSVSVVLGRYWPDQRRWRDSIRPVVRDQAAAAARAQTFREELAVVRAMLARIPSSSLTLTTSSAYRTLRDALGVEQTPTLGLQLMQWDGRWYAVTVLDGGPAFAAGIRDWDEVLRIDGSAPDSSAIIDFSLDDAYLPDSLDPPVHPLRADSNVIVSFTMRTGAGASEEFRVPSRPYSAWEASQRTARVIVLDGIRIAYLHLWYMPVGADAAAWVAARFRAEWRDVDAVVLDLRGRGGDGALAGELARRFQPGGERVFDGPVVVLQDRRTRGSKELLLEQLRAIPRVRTVGEPSAGAVVASGGRPVGYGLTLMMPANPLNGATARLELHPQPPDVPVSWGGPLSGARDPILQAGLAEAVRVAETTGRGRVLSPVPAPEPLKTRPLPP